MQPRLRFLPCSTTPAQRAGLSHEPQPDPNIADLAAVTPEEVAEALFYALRYDELGKPRRVSWDFAAGLAAERLTDHLRRSRFVVMRVLPGCPHNAA